MGGGATVSGQLLMIYQPGLVDFNLGRSGRAQVSDGSKGMGTDGAGLNPQATVAITFATPLSEFGAYWGAFTGGNLPDTASISLSFFGAGHSLLGSEVFTIHTPRSGEIPIT